MAAVIEPPPLPADKPHLPSSLKMPEEPLRISRPGGNSGSLARVEDPLWINRSEGSSAGGNSGSFAKVDEAWSRESLVRDAAEVARDVDAEAEVGAAKSDAPPQRPGSDAEVGAERRGPPSAALITASSAKAPPLLCLAVRGRRL